MEAKRFESVLKQLDVEGLTEDQARGLMWRISVKYIPVWPRRDQARDFGWRGSNVALQHRPTLGGGSKTDDATANPARADTSFDEIQPAILEMLQAENKLRAAAAKAPPSESSKSDDDEGSEEDWQEVKAEVLKLLQAELLDTPESHLAYIHERLQPVFDHGAVES